MAAVLKCPCGEKVAAPEGAPAEGLTCPRCKKVVRAAAATQGVQAAPSPPPAATREPRPTGKPPSASVQTAPSPPPLPPPAGQEAVTTVLPEPEGEDRPRKRKAKVRRQGLDRVNTALAFHFFFNPFAFLGAAAACWAGWTFSSLALVPGLNDPLAAPAAFFVAAGGVLLLITGLAELAPTLIILSAGPQPGRGLILGALALRLVACGLALLVLLLPDFQPLLLLLALLAMIGGWCLWMGFLKQLGRSLKREEVSREAVRVCLGGLGAVGMMFSFLVVAVIMVVLFAKLPFIFSSLFTAAFIGAVAKIAFTVGKFDSLTEFFLTPFGLPYTFRYLNFIGGVRALVDRRT
jgi:hypothetical protein